MARRSIPKNYIEPAYYYVLGDKVELTYLVRTGTNTYQSFTDYTLESKLLDRFGTELATLTVTKSTTNTTDDTLTVTGLPASLPTTAGTYAFYLTATLTADATDITTYVKGTITFEDKEKLA